MSQVHRKNDLRAPVLDLDPVNSLELGLFEGQSTNLSLKLPTGATCRRGVGTPSG